MLKIVPLSDDAEYILCTISYATVQGLVLLSSPWYCPRTERHIFLIIFCKESR
jgi:hypothetical protein